MAGPARQTLKVILGVSIGLGLTAVFSVLAVLTALRVGGEAGLEPATAAAEHVVPAPTTPPGSVTFAGQSRELAVALAVRPGRPLLVVSTVLGPSGRGMDDLDVRVSASRGVRRASAPTRACGQGCYSASLRLARPKAFGVHIAGAGPARSLSFPATEAWPPRSGTVLLRRATRAFERLRSAVFTEHLAAGPVNAIDTTWKLLTPNRVEYAIRGGAGGIVIGGVRWDRPAPGARWQRSETTPLQQPSPPWGARQTNARLLRVTGDAVTLSWVDPGVPAWFTGTFDRGTSLPRELSMTAAAHFMRHRYLSYDRPLKIAPPRRR